MYIYDNTVTKYTKKRTSGLTPGCVIITVHCAGIPASHHCSSIKHTASSALRLPIWLFGDVVNASWLTDTISEKYFVSYSLSNLIKMKTA